MEWQDEVQEDELRDATRRFLPDTVVWTTDWTTGSLMEQISRDVFNVDPPFQRRSAWNDRKASLYIESLLLGCPVPPITLAELPAGGPGPHQYIVIDGKQRLGTLKRFAIEQSLRLTGLETLVSLNGATFGEVSKLSEFSRFENLPIRTNVMRNWKKDEVLQFVFHRLNSQVTPLSTHELRRSLLAGKFTDYLDERSAKSSGIQRILNINEPDYRLRDAELLLRAIAFSCFFARYKGNLKNFLDSATRNFNRSWNAKLQTELDHLAAGIDLAIEAIYEIFDEDAFQRMEGNEATGRFNRAIFDIMVLTMRHEAIRAASVARGSEVRELFRELGRSNPEFNRWTEATTKSREAVQGRVREWAEALGALLSIRRLPELAASSAIREYE